MALFNTLSLLGLAAFLPFLLTNNFLYKFKPTNMILFAIGLTFVVIRAARYIKMMYAALKPHKDLAERYGKGSWAFVTGASDGIGKAFIFKLASEGFNIVLLGRNKEKLEDVVSELKAKFPSVLTRIVVRDLTKAEKEDFAEGIFEEVEDLDISIVINNAGNALMAQYIEHSTKDIRDLVIMNCLALALITRVFIPKLLERKNKAALINISSEASINPLPKFQLYAATKSFVDFLTNGLYYEHPNLDILTVKPALVKTKLTDDMKQDYFTVEPHECVEGVFSALGRVRDTPGHWKHCLQGWAKRNLPPYFKDRAAKGRAAREEGSS